MDEKDWTQPMGLDEMLAIEEEQGNVSEEQQNTPSVVSVSLPEGGLSAEGSDLPGLLCAVLARKVRDNYLRGEQEPRIVTLPASVARLKELLSGSNNARNKQSLIAALEYLSSIAIADGEDRQGRRKPWPLVERYHFSTKKPPGGGRTSKVVVVHCGFPLAPYVLKSRYQELGVLDPAKRGEIYFSICIQETKNDYQ